MSEKIYRFKDGKKTISIEAKNEVEAWEKMVKKYNYNDVNDYFKSIDGNLNNAPILLNSDHPLLYKREIRLYNSCKNYGGTWVKGYTKKIHGKTIKVNGYCKDDIESRYNKY